MFKGEFAQYLNIAFPDRKLYLFDTFEGFESNEAAKEVSNANITDTEVDAFKNTSVDLVMEKMVYTNQVIIRKGYFPQTADGLDEQYAFVSIDMDLEDSIYSGLEYFYPRLSSGGYIFIHDYNSVCQAVEWAVDKYEKDIGKIIPKVPVADANGTLVITK